MYKLSIKYDPNQPRHPAGSGVGGQWSTSGAGYSASNKYMKDLLGYGEATDGSKYPVDNPNFRYAEPGAWAAYTRMINEYGDEHEEAYNYIPHTNLYQAGHYQNINYALRHPDEMELFNSIYYTLQEESDDFDPRAWSEQAWEESGMADATGKDFDSLLSPEDFESSNYIASEMDRGFREHAPTLPKNITMYRSFRPRDLLKRPQDFVGKKFHDEGFSSMTMSGWFAHRWNVGAQKAILRVTTKGTEQGLHLRKSTYGGQNDPYEFEILLGAGTTFRITKITQSADGDLLVDAEIDDGTSTKADKGKKSKTRTRKPLTTKPDPAKFAWDEDDCRTLFPSQKYDPSQPRAPAGSSTGGQWVASGGVIPRTAMPQILSSDLPDFYKYARSKGVSVRKVRVSATRLKYRQSVDPAHAKAIPESSLRKPILISKDNYVLDGNHRAAANAALKRSVNAYRINLPFKKAVDFMFTYPKVKNLEAAQDARKVADVELNIDGVNERYVVKYDPNQPRDPAGSPTGGQWSSSGFAGVTFEVAPNPNDKKLSARWDKLSSKEKSDVSREVLRALMPKLAEEMGIDTKNLESHVGGWMGKINPSYTLRVNDVALSPSVAAALGEALRQEGMMVVANKKFAGAVDGDVIAIKLPNTKSSTIRSVYKKIDAMRDGDGERLVPGFTMSGEHMTIVNIPDWSGQKGSSIAKRVNEALGNQYDVFTQPVYARFPEQGEYRNASYRPTGRSGPSWTGSLDSLQQAADLEVEKALGRRGKEEGPRYRITLRYDPNQPRAPAGSSNGGQWVSPGSFGGSAAQPSGEYATVDGSLEADTGLPAVPPHNVEQGYFHFGGPGNSDSELEVSGDLMDEIGASGYHGTTDLAQDFHDALSAEHIDHRYEMADEYQTEAIHSYQTFSYKEMNDYAADLSDGEEPDVDTNLGHMVYNLDEAIGDAPGIPKGTTLYRSFRNSTFADTAHQNIGRQYRERRFMSTTVNANMAYAWADGKYDYEGLVVLRLTTSKRINGLYLARAREDGYIGNETYEFEALLPRNTSFTVTKVKRVWRKNGKDPVTVVDGVIS